MLGGNPASYNVYAWGTNTSGQLGAALGGTQYFPGNAIDLNVVPFTGQTVDSWKSISVGSNHMAAIRASDSSLWTWGGNSTGQLGDGTTVAKSSPVKIGSSSWSMVAAGRDNFAHTVAIDITGALYAWGSGNYLGDGTTISKSSPVKIGSSSWSMVNTGITHTVGLTVDKRAFGWGNNGYGELGFPFSPATWYYSPILLASGSSFSFISGGINNTAFINLADSSLWTMGRNLNGELGDGTTINKSTPVKIGNSSWSMVDLGGQGASALKPSLGLTINGALFTWGANNLGQLGDGTAVSKSSPVKIGSSSWSMVSSGFSHASAIDITGALYAWGGNSTGQLGDGTIVAKSSPVKIGSSSWSMVNTYNHTAAFDINGVLYTWGNNGFGNLGDFSTISKSRPVTIVTTNANPSNITQINTTGTGSTAFLDGYSVWTIGNNTVGQLGDGTTVNKNTLTRQFTGKSPKVTTGSQHMLAILDNTLYAWGLSTTWQLGTGDANNKSSPVILNLSTNDEDTTQDTWKSI